MPGLIGKKVGMTNIYNEAGKSIACTLVEAGPCVVTQVKNEDSDGYRAVQLAYDDKKEKNRYIKHPSHGHQQLIFIVLCRYNVNRT